MSKEDRAKAQELLELAQELPPSATDYIRGYAQGVMDAAHAEDNNKNGDS